MNGSSFWRIAVCEKCEKEQTEFQRLKERVEPLGHVSQYVGASMSDQYKCSCGWKSNRFWDLVEAAIDEWINHAKDILKKAGSD